MKFVFLGTGASSGVPVAGCQCDVCLSSDRKNKRLRTSGLLFNQEKNLLIDASPDIRMIALQRDMRHVTALFITHPHEDHIGGLNDLRSFTFLHT